MGEQAPHDDGAARVCRSGLWRRTLPRCVVFLLVLGVIVFPTVIEALGEARFDAATLAAAEVTTVDPTTKHALEVRVVGPAGLEGVEAGIVGREVRRVRSSLAIAHEIGDRVTVGLPPGDRETALYGRIDWWAENREARLLLLMGVVLVLSFCVRTESWWVAGCKPVARQSASTGFLALACVSMAFFAAMMFWTTEFTPIDSLSNTDRYENAVVLEARVVEVAPDSAVPTAVRVDLPDGQVDVYRHVDAVTERAHRVGDVIEVRVRQTSSREVMYAPDGAGDRQSEIPWMMRRLGGVFAFISIVLAITLAFRSRADKASRGSAHRSSTDQ